MPLTFRSSTPDEVFIAHTVGGRSIAVIGTRDQSYDSNSTYGSQRFTLTVTEGREVTKTASVIGTRRDVHFAAMELLADAEARGPYRPPANLNPLRGSVGLPAAPVVSMGRNSDR